MSNSKNTSKHILMQGSILAAASVLVRIIGLIYRIPMTRILGDTAMGYYSYAFEIYNIILILSSYSIPLAVSKLISSRLVLEENKNAYRVFKFTIIFSTIIGALATCFLWFFADTYGKIIKVPEVAIPLRVLAPTIFVFSMMGVLRGFFQGHHNMVPTALSQIIEQIINAIVSVGASYYFIIIFKSSTNKLAYGAAGGTLGTLSGAVSSLIVLIFIYFSHKSKINGELTNKSGVDEGYKHIFVCLIATAIPVILSQTIYQISGVVDSIFYNRIEAKQGVSDVVRSTNWSIYSNKYRLLTNVPVAIASALGTAIVPSLISEYVTGKTDNIKKKIASATKFNMIIACPCAAGMIALAKPILGLVFGDFSDTSANVMMLGGICVLFFCSSTVTNGALQGINKMRIPVIHSSISLVIHIILLVVLLKNDFGIYALVICNVLFPVVVSLLNMQSLYKYLGYKQELFKTYLIPIISSAIMGGLGYMCYKATSFAGNTIAVGISIIFCILLYFVLLIKLKGVSREELIEMPKGTKLVKILTKLHLL